MELKDSRINEKYTNVVAGEAPSPMKLAFIEVRYKETIALPDSFVKQLPKKIILFTNIQYHPQYGTLKERLEQAGKEVITVRPKHAWNEGQILGCSVEDCSEKGMDAFVYVGDGLFHPKAILFHNEEPVYMYDPKTNEQSILRQEDIQSILKKRKGALVTFHSKKKVGVLITSKYGQERLKMAQRLEEKFPEKEFYYLLADSIDFGSLEDFSFIEVFINTACPRVMDDHDKVPRPVLNIGDIMDEEW